MNKKEEFVSLDEIVDSLKTGDLVFFHNTYDRNRDGRLNDSLTHVGVVEEVKTDGTVTYVHHAGARILRFRMNLDQPNAVRDPKTGRRLNHPLRRASGSQPSMTSGQLFAGYGTLSLSR